MFIQKCIGPSMSVPASILYLNVNYVGSSAYIDCAGGMDGCLCCVLSGRGPCDEPITLPEESYRLWCVVVCDLETSFSGWHSPNPLRSNSGGDHEHFFLLSVLL